MLALFLQELSMSMDWQQASRSIRVEVEAVLIRGGCCWMKPRTWNLRQTSIQSQELAAVEGEELRCSLWLKLTGVWFLSLPIVQSAV